MSILTKTITFGRESHAGRQMTTQLTKKPSKLLDFYWEVKIMEEFKLDEK